MTFSVTRKMLTGSVPVAEPGERNVVGHLHRHIGVLAKRPALIIFIVALIARLSTVVAIHLFHDGVVIPDEGQYLTLALVASEGQLTPHFWGGYGQSLFNATRTFTWPLTAFFWLFGPSRVVAQLVPVLFGAVTAAATTVIAGRFLRRRYAIVAGLIVAVFPSQVLWSSVVLREALIWAGLAGIAVVVGYSQRQRSEARVMGSVLVAGLLFIGLVWLRSHTAAIALWCLFPALLVSRSGRSVRATSAIFVLVIAPWLVGMGPAAVPFGKAAFSRTGTAHGYMSMNANSSVSVFQRLSAETSGSLCDTLTNQESGTWSEIENLAGRLLEREKGDWVCIHESMGAAILVDNRVSSALGRLPRGLVNTMLRPFPWEPRWSNLEFLLASFETLLWIVLYILSAHGLWRHRDNIQQLVFPVLVTGSIVLSGAVTQGNLGTAFRHRGQILFALAILSAGGLQAISDRAGYRRTGQDTVHSVEAGGIPAPSSGPQDGSER